MNLYFLNQIDNLGYGTYDSMIVAAESEENARKLYPEPGSEQVVLLRHVDTLEKHCIEYLNRYGQESWELIQIERQIKDESRSGFAVSLSALAKESYTIKCTLKRQL